MLLLNVFLHILKALRKLKENMLCKISDIFKMLLKIRFKQHIECFIIVEYK